MLTKLKLWIEKALSIAEEVAPDRGERCTEAAAVPASRPACARDLSRQNLVLPLLAIGSKSRQPVRAQRYGAYMLSDLSFDDYLRAGGWRGFAQKAAKNAFVTEARSWLAPLQQMLDAEEARLRALKSTTPDDFLLVVAIKRQLGTLKRYLKISTDDARPHQTMQTRAFRARQKAKTKRIRRTRRRRV
jgi:hypothetical protein